MYYVRRLSKTSNLSKIKTMTNVQTMSADILGQEMKTTGDALSVWRFSTLDSEEMKDALKAAVLTGTDIVKTQFIILDSDSLSEAGISTDDSELGKTGYKGLECTHTNLCNLTYEKIGILLCLYQKIIEDPSRTPAIEREDMKKIICELHQEDKLNVQDVHEHLKEKIKKLLETMQS